MFLFTFINNISSKSNLIFSFLVIQQLLAQVWNTWLRIHISPSWSLKMTALGTGTQTSLTGLVSVSMAQNDLRKLCVVPSQLCKNRTNAFASLLRKVWSTKTKFTMMWTILLQSMASRTLRRSSWSIQSIWMCTKWSKSICTGKPWRTKQASNISTLTSSVLATLDLATTLLRQRPVTWDQQLAWF